MTTLVTGATGFLGRRLVPALRSRIDGKIRCLVRSGSAGASALRTLAERHSNVEIVEGSLGSPESAGKVLEGVDRVVHAAAAMSGPAPDLFLNTVVASRNLLAATGGRPMRFVLVSSFSVYGVAPLPWGALVDETTPLEADPARRDAYAHAKLRQEELFWEHAEHTGSELVVVRPGVIYGPENRNLSGRIGLWVGETFLHLGGDNTLPLTFVDNCADAIATAAVSEAAIGRAFNVVDDDLPTCARYLARYAAFCPIRSVRVPYAVTHAAGWLADRTRAHDHGAIPPFLTSYRVRSTWRGMQFSNGRLKALGWTQPVRTEEALRRTFA